MRVDLNVPQNPDGSIADTFRLDAMLPTLRLLQDKKARIILISHLGRPEGPDPKLSLKPVADKLAERLGSPIAFAADTVGDEAQAAAAHLQPGEVLLLENLRFDPREEANDPVFAKALAALADLYVNDAFATAHRAHASTVGVAQFLPSLPGPLLEHELAMLDKALGRPEQPLLVIVGGAKISTKLALLDNLTPKADAIFVGGAMANTFLAAQGMNIGASLAEPDLIPTANTILLEGANRRCEIMLPIDAVIRSGDKKDIRIVPAQSVTDGWAIYDIGPATCLRLEDKIAEAQTIIWNGPLGLFEQKPFEAGTFAVAQMLATRAKEGATVVAGGGDTVAALTQCGLLDKLTFVSTAGGAFLEWMEGKELPGLAALKTSSKS